MRPNASLDPSIHRPRKRSIEQVAGPISGPTTFFLASESDLNRRAFAAPTSPQQDPPPVRTLKETLEEVNREVPTSPSRPDQSQRDSSRRRSTIRPKSNEHLRHEAIKQQAAPSGPPSTLLTPSLTPSQASSLPSSPKSLSSRSLPKSEDELTQDENSSQAVESGDEEDQEQIAASAASLQDSAPQLIMPSIRMPSRRPFTERGKAMGRFKIMVVGSEGSGKTSLIKSIVQLCEDIVHVDPLSSSITSSSKSSTKRSTSQFVETYASTKPYPSWWSETEESRILKRRKSMGDFVLERNLCFVDTSYAKTSSIIDYIEQQLLNAVQSAAHVSGEVSALLSGQGGTQVDLVLWVVSHTTIKDDCEQMLQLGRVANVVPLLSKSDQLSQEQIEEIKSAVDGNSCSVPRLPINFNAKSSITSACSAPYSISCVNGPDFDNMDASLLMSSEYVQPLLPSELKLLVDQIFQPDNMAYLRHLGARKLISWYNSTSRTARAPSPSVQASVLSTLNSPLQASLSVSGVLIPITSELSLNTSNSFALARIADHTHKQERLAQIRLSKWASDLQLSLQRERERYESIARSERALWLVERMGEEIKDGQLVPIADAAEVIGKRKKKAKLYQMDGMTYQVHDPLGLLKWQDAVRAQTWLALQVVGSFGVVGGLALWITKTWDIGTSFHQWAQEWGIWHE